MSTPERHWTGLPPGSSARLLVPTDSPALVRGGLLLYQPMTGRGRLAWRIAWGAAATGLFRHLPRAAAPELPDPLLAAVPQGGTVAVAHTNVPNRIVVLIIDRLGIPQSVAKVAGDALGRSRLGAEAAALDRARGLLPMPLTAPRLLAIEDDYLLMEAVAWRIRPDPWELPVEVARAVGHFHRSNQNPTHGDFAPWNLMLTGGGWTVLDWEEFTLDSPPYVDVFHYLVQGHSLLGRPRRDELLAGLRGDGWIGQSLDAYAEAAGLPAGKATDAFAAYLEDSSARLRQDPQRRGALRGIEARQSLLAALSTRN